MTAVQEYFAGLSPESRRELKKMRQAIRAAAPGAVEGISWGMPSFKLNGRALVYYAAWKNHSSLYPMSAAMRRSLGDSLKGYDTSSKGTIRFPNDKPIPLALIKRLVKARIAEVRAKSRSKSA